ncbi:MAG TPA: TolC family protein [Bacteroidia bacterium]|jgi:outer membrane protein TolC|nr:TolC family protein [Bacteroidia bacterium]
MKRITTFMIFLAIAAGSSAQTTLTLEQAIQKGMANSSQMKIDSAKYAQTLIKQQEISDYAIPTLKVNAGYARLSNITPLMFQFPGNPEPVTFLPNIPNTYSLSASMQEQIFSGWKLKYTKESYEFLAKAAALDTVKDANAVRMNIITAYYTMVKLQMSMKTLEDDITAAKQRVTETQSLLAHDMATDNDVLKAQLFESNLETSLADLQSTFSVTQFNFNILIGNNNTTLFTPDTTGIFSAQQLLAESAYESAALTNRSELAYQQYMVQSAESNVNAAHSVYYPTVNVGADYLDARPNQRIFPLTDEFRQTWDVGISLSWNLTNLYTGKHGIADAQMTLLQSEEMNSSLKDQVRMDVFKCYSECLNDQNKMKNLQLALEQATENSRQVKAKFDNKTALMSDVLDADAAVLQAKINLVVLQADTKLAYYQLMQATGQLK